MQFIDPHIHMVSRTTDDYQKLALAGCLAVTEPAFWAGFDRSKASNFFDYFDQISEFEPSRAAQYGIKHYTWLCINPKEAEDLSLAMEVIEGIPSRLDRPTVLGIGEIGLNKNSKNEMTILEAHIELAAKHDQLILSHTPHLEDKRKGTQWIIDAIKNEPRIKPEKVLIDHCEEHTIKTVLDEGMWAGLTLYPTSKCTPERAIDIYEMYGPDRIWINSAADWGISDPLAVPKAALEMKRRGHSDEAVHGLVVGNPDRFLSQCPKWSLD